MRDAVWIVGVSMTKFGRYPDKDIIDLSSEAARAALADAGVPLSDIDFLAFGTTSETNNASQRLMAQIGYRPIPAFNVANGCATGAVALRLCIQSILAGEASMALAVGAQVMGKAGLLGNASRGGKDGAKPFVRRGRWGTVMSIEGRIGTGTFPGTFSHAGMEYALENDVTFDQFAKVAVKNHEPAPAGRKDQRLVDPVPTVVRGRVDPTRSQHVDATVRGACLRSRRRGSRGSRPSRTARLLCLSRAHAL